MNIFRRYVKRIDWAEKYQNFQLTAWAPSLSLKTDQHQDDNYKLGYNVFHNHRWLYGRPAQPFVAAGHKWYSIPVDGPDIKFRHQISKARMQQWNFVHPITRSHGKSQHWHHLGHKNVSKNSWFFAKITLNTFFLNFAELQVAANNLLKFSKLSWFVQ